MRKVKMTTTAAPVESMISSLFLRGSTWQTSLFPSDQAMKTPHFEQSPFWKGKGGLPQLLRAQWVPGLKKKRPERTPQKVINDRYVLIFALYCQLTHWKTSCRTCTSGKYFPMAPYRHRGSAGIQSFHVAFAGSKVKVWFYMVYLSENWMLSKPSEGMAYLHGLLSTSTHLVADLAFKTSQENRSRGKL
jgi:hypothetical protein